MNFIHDEDGDMTRDNPVRGKSYTFALRVIETVRTLQQRKEYVLSNQLLVKTSQMPTKH